MYFGTKTTHRFIGFPYASIFRLLLIGLSQCIALSAFTQKTTPIATAQRATGYSFANNTLIVQVKDGSISINAIHPNTFQIVFEGHSFTNPPSYALAESVPSRNKQVTLKDTGKSLLLSTGQMRAVFDKKSESLQFFYHDQWLTSEVNHFVNDSLRGFEFKISKEEHLTGGGERVLGVNRRGKKLLLYNKPSYGYETHAEVMYYSIPAYISDKKYMVLFDNGAKGWMDLDSDGKNRVRFSAKGGRMSYLVTGAANWQEFSKAQADICGYQPMVPRWVLGNISSRMGYHSQREVEDVVRRFHTEKIPLDAMVLDLYWFGKTLKGTLGEMQWYADSFPDGAGMVRRLYNKGIKTVLISEPFILKGAPTYKEVVQRGIEGKTKDGCPFLYDFYFGNTILLDIFNPGAKVWLWAYYRKYIDQGIAGWWGDLGEPEVHPDSLYHCNGKAVEVHNLYGHEWARTIYEGFRRDYPLKRPVILMRAGFAGTQRFGIIPWSGDVNRTWGGLQSQVEIATTMSLMGLSYMHSDLGGFAGDYKDAELYTRWIQYGVFQPVFRTHAQEEVPPECVFWDSLTLDIARRFIRLRYALLPYNYTLSFKNSILGTPLMRPLFYRDNDKELFDRTDCYYWGDNFLVRPITQPGVKAVSIRLPKGAAWIDFWTDKRYNGGKTIKQGTHIATIPVFVRAGAFIPMVDPVSNTGSYSSEKLYVHYYGDASIRTASDSMYEDDGKLFDAYGKKRYEMVHFEYKYDREGNAHTFRFYKTGDGYSQMPSKRDLSLILHRFIQPPKKIWVKGKPIEHFSYDRMKHTLIIPAEWKKGESQIVIRIKT